MVESLLYGFVDSDHSIIECSTQSRRERFFKRYVGAEVRWRWSYRVSKWTMRDHACTPTRPRLHTYTYTYLRTLTQIWHGIPVGAIFQQIPWNLNVSVYINVFGMRLSWGHTFLKLSENRKFLYIHVTYIYIYIYIYICIHIWISLSLSLSIYIYICIPLHNLRQQMSASCGFRRASTSTVCGALYFCQQRSVMKTNSACRMLTKPCYYQLNQQNI